MDWPGMPRQPSTIAYDEPCGRLRPPKPRLDRKATAAIGPRPLSQRGSEDHWTERERGEEKLRFERLSRSSQGNEIIFADALQDEKDRRGIPCIGDEVRPLGWDRKGLARRQSHLFFGVLEKDTDRSGHHIKSVVDVVVIVPRYFLRGSDLQLGDAKARAGGEIGAVLHLVQLARIFHSSHAVSSMDCADHSALFVSGPERSRPNQSASAPDNLTTLARFPVSS